MRHFKPANSLEPGKLTLAHPILALQARDDLSPGRQRRLISACRRIAKLVGGSPERVPLDISLIREKLASVNLASARMSAKTYANLRSDFAGAVAESGLAPGAVRLGWRRRPPLSREWIEFEASLRTIRERAGLSRLMHFASLRRILPSEVDATTLDALLSEMHATSLRQNQYRLHRSTALIWNEVATRISE